MERVPLENRANVIQCTTFACFGSKRPLVVFTERFSFGTERHKNTRNRIFRENKKVL